MPTSDMSEEQTELDWFYEQVEFISRTFDVFSKTVAKQTEGSEMRIVQNAILQGLLEKFLIYLGDTSRDMPDELRADLDRVRRRAFGTIVFKPGGGAFEWPTKKKESKT